MKLWNFEISYIFFSIYFVLYHYLYEDDVELKDTLQKQLTQNSDDWSKCALDEKHTLSQKLSLNGDDVPHHIFMVGSSPKLTHEDWTDEKDDDISHHSSTMNDEKDCTFGTF